MVVKQHIILFAYVLLTIISYAAYDETVNDVMESGC